MNFFKMSLLTAAVCLSISVPGRADTSITVTPEDDIQSIIDGCGDSATNKVTIYLQPGKYKSFTALSDMEQIPRYINLIGKGDVTVESTSGNYEEAAAEIRLDGTVENINFIASHPENEIELVDKGAYAVHSDYGSMHTVFNDCTFTSYQTASVGMGISYDSEVTFNNCRFENKATQAFGTGWKMGAIYVHSGYSDKNVSGAKLNINKCSYHFPGDAYSGIVVQELNGCKIEVNET